MSTRATYKIDGMTFYIHHDGYPEGAAVYFYNMVEAVDAGRGGFTEAFIRGNAGAEITSCHETHADTEFRYTLVDNTLTAERVVWGEDKHYWETFYFGDLVGFTQEHNAMLEGELHQIETSTTESFSHLVTWTTTQIENAIMTATDQMVNSAVRGHWGNASYKAKQLTNFLKQYKSEKVHDHYMGRVTWAEEMYPDNWNHFNQVS